MSKYSALGQDRWVIEEVFSFKRGGFFVEAGALNGVDESNTYLLEKDYGWKGLCVEPASAYFESLKKSRTCFVENLCLLDRETEVDFLEAGGHGGIPSFFSKDYIQKGRKTTKQAVPLQLLLRKYNAPSVIDYLSLDTEGTEYLILKDFPFNEFRFLSITVEHNNNAMLRDQLRNLLISNGYILCREVLVDDWWVHESHYSQINGDRRRLWELLNQFPPSEVQVRAFENYQKLQDLQKLNASLAKTLVQCWKLLRKRLILK